MKRNRFGKLVLTLAFLSMFTAVTPIAALAYSPTDLVTSYTFQYDAELGADPNHGYVISPSQSGNYMLNQYTSASVTPSGTILTTWKTTGHATQAWTKKVSSSGDYAIVCANNEWVAININRSNTAQANVYQLIDNYYADVAISARPANNYGGIYLYVGSRGNNSGKYLKITNRATPASDGNGTSWLCAWENTGSVFYEGDWISSSRRLARYIR